MRRRNVLSAWLVFALTLAPNTSFASSNESLSRIDAFVTIWESIRRPAEKSSERPFADVGKDHPNFSVINYAKARGIVDDDENFRPTDPLFLSDVLLWLFRTRNVDDPAAIKRENLPGLLARYPLGDFVTTAKKSVDVPVKGSGRTVKRTEVTKSIKDRTIDAAELASLISSLDALLRKEDHEISFYSEKFQGDGTSYGEKFDMHALTAAHKWLPYNTVVRVTNVENGKSVVVRINDRGPFVPGRDMDLSLAAFETITTRSRGKIRATFERLGDVRLVSGCLTETRGERGSSRAQARRAARMQRACAR